MRMKPLDAMWLLMESPETPMHVGVLAVFEPPQDASEDFPSHLAERMREATTPVAPWNLRLSRGRSASLRPRLEPVRDFDLDYHFRHSALPGNGGERELGITVSRLHSAALDRNKPLWVFHLIEGLEGGRFAFYVKVHHALVDAVNGIPMMLAMLSESVERRAMLPLWMQPLPGAEATAEAASAEDDWSNAERSAALDVQRAPVAALGKAAFGLLRSALNPGATGSFLRARSTPHSTLNRRINAQRRVATQTFEQARIERVAQATDSSLLDILVYLCGSSLRRFFKEYNALPDDSLVGLLPLSLPERGDGLSGNAIAANRIAMATDIGDPLARLAAVKASVAAVQEDRFALPEEGAASYMLMRSAPVYASQIRGVEHLIPPLYNLRMSHTLGSAKPLYFEGARLQAVYPFSHLMQCNALNVGIVNYAGNLNIGFTGARDTLPHLQRMAVYFGKALADLEELVFADPPAISQGTGVTSAPSKRVGKRQGNKKPEVKKGAVKSAGKKGVVKNTDGKKAEVKKAESKKAEVKKTESKKAEGKKAEGKKVESKKADVKKGQGQKGQGKKQQGKPKGSHQDHSAAELK